MGFFLDDWRRFGFSSRLGFRGGWSGRRRLCECCSEQAGDQRSDYFGHD
jgi:hypothetical protein